MIDYRLDLVTAPSIEPVTLTEAKDFLRVTGTDDDDLITSLIVAARTNAESYTRRAFITQTWKLLRDEWPFDKTGSSKGDPWWDGVRQLPISEIRGQEAVIMPLAPLQSITSVITYDDDDSSNTFATSNYQVSAYSGDFANRGRVTLRTSGNGWPAFTRRADGIEIIFIAGYGDAAADVPSQIKQAILLEVTELYENRGSCGGDVCCDIAKKLLDPFRIIKL